MDINEAVDCYHGLVADDHTTAQQQLQDGLRARGLYFGDRPLCRVLRPYFYLQGDWDALKAKTEVILSAFGKAHAACMTDAGLRQQLGLEAYEEQLFSLDHNLEIPWTTSRLDSFYIPNQGKLSFVEYNAETPAGIGYGDLLVEAFMELDTMKRFGEFYHIHAFPGLGHLLGALLHGYKQWGGQQKPQIAIIDWQDVPTLNEHEIIRQYFERNGYATIMADPRALEYRNGVLWAGDFRIDLLYKRVLINELIRQMGVDNAIVQAVRDRAVFMTNSFSCKLMAKKASLAFISDERNAHLFTATERAAIDAHIPWTRRVSERKTSYNGAEIDLLPFIVGNREKLVLKPNDEYGGKGVVLGWDCTAEEWLATLRDALVNPYVVQEKVQTVVRDFPMVLDDGTLDISPRYVDADPFVYYGKTVGACLTRLSSVALLNVTAGGGSVAPMFVLEKKGS